jgi:hypothetical protein
MAELDQYNLKAQYSFLVGDDSLRKMSDVEKGLRNITTATEQLKKAMSSMNVDRSLQAQFKGIKNIASLPSSGKSAQNLKNTASAIGQVRSQYRLLMATSKNALNLEEGLKVAPNLKKNAEALDKYDRRVKAYVKRLRQLDDSLEGVNHEEQIFKEQIRSSINDLRKRKDAINAQRKAMEAAEDKGFWDGLRGASSFALNELASRGKAATNVFAEFDDQMAAVGAVSRASAEDLKLLRDRSKQLGASTRYTAGQAAQAERMLAAAGFRAKDILIGVEDALSLASAGQIELGQSADIASNVLSGFGKKAEELAHITDVMALAAASANTSISQMGTAMSYAAPPAKLFGAGVEETSALIGAMSDAGIQADKAGTAIRSMYLRLASPPAEAGKWLNQLNISVADSKTGKLRDIVDVLEELQTKLQLDPKTLSDTMVFFDQVNSMAEETGKSFEEAFETIKAKDPTKASVANQQRAVEALNAIFGKSGVSGASAAIGSLDKVKWMTLAGAASSVQFEKAIQDQSIATEEYAKAMELAQKNKTGFFEEFLKIAPDFASAKKLLQIP